MLKKSKKCSIKNIDIAMKEWDTLSEFLYWPMRLIKKERGGFIYSGGLVDFIEFIINNREERWKDWLI